MQDVPQVFLRLGSSRYAGRAAFEFRDAQLYQKQHPQQMCIAHLPSGPPLWVVSSHKVNSGRAAWQ